MYDRVNGNPPTNNAPLRGGKATQYEGGTRVPQIVIWPDKIKPNSQSAALFSSVDWFPTLKTMCDLKTPDIAFDGVNQVPALLEQGTPRTTLFCYFPHYVPATGAVPTTWVRRGDWKLIRYFNAGAKQKDAFELYSLKDDIGEARNLAIEKPELVRELNALISLHLKETGALIPGPNPNFGNKEKTDKLSDLTSSKDAQLEWKDELLHLVATGEDPYFWGELPKTGKGPYSAQWKMKSNLKNIGQLFWATEHVKNFGPAQRLDFEAIHDNAWHEYTVKIDSPSALTRLRIDPGNGPGEVWFEWLRLRDGVGQIVKEWKAPR